MVSSAEAIRVTSYEVTTNSSFTCACGTVPCRDMHSAIKCLHSSRYFPFCHVDDCQFVHQLLLLLLLQVIVWMNDLHPFNRLWIYSSLASLPSSALSKRSTYIVIADARGLDVRD